MECAMKVVKDIDVNLIKGIIPLPEYKGTMVTVTVSDYNPPRRSSKQSMRDAMSRLENGINPSNRSLDSFRAERLSKYEVVD